MTLTKLEKNKVQANQQGIDGSARKPALIQDTGYIVEKTYPDIAPYLGVFGAYLIQKLLLECSSQLTLSYIWSKSH